MKCQYVRDHYGVPAEIGRRVSINGEEGVIAEDRGNYIGVNLDKHKPGLINNYHPTCKVTYLGMGAIRKPSRSTARYQRYREYGDGFNSFIDFCRWDAHPDREWNQRY
jgi:hypothetical protein